jgi:hypothetical protein
MKTQVLTSGFHFRRATPEGLVQVFNENSYLMALYNPSTGVASWQRVVLATQKATIERWLEEHYPSTNKKLAARA